MVGEKLKLKLTGQKFGRLTVLQELETVNLESRWLCKCECGNQIESVGWHLTKGLVKSCGCLVSHGEEKISLMLKENNIEFVQQKTFDGCVSPNNVKLKFDFYIENKYLLEFDGSQHFLTEPNQRFSMEDIERIRQYDEIKNKWCKENNVPLIRIKYDQLKNLTIDDLLLKE